MTDTGGAIVRIIWPLLAALAGSVTALSFKPWQTMSRVEIALSLFVGAAFATFVGPVAAQKVLGLPQSEDYRWYGFVLYVMATGSNVLIPLLVNKASQLLGSKPEGEAL